MSELFLSVLNMSLTASYVIIFVIFTRLLLKKAPKVISYAMWGVVAFRLIIPFSFESIFSLMPPNTNAIPIPQDIIYQQNPQIDSGIKVVDSFFSNSLPEATANTSINPIQIYIAIGSYIWIIGIVALVFYSIISILILKRKLKGAELIEKNVFEVKNLKTPFVLGLISPKIYLPDGLNSEERRYILLHEQTHINRKDNIIKVVAFLILSIHWFNPLVWIAFMLMSEDMELSCDERVLKEINEDIKKPYANSLLSLATGKHILNGSPLAFGEGNVKSRIKNVLNYKKSKLYIIIITVVLALAVGIGLLANPINIMKISDIDTVPLESLDEAVYGTLTSENKHMDFNEAKAEEIAYYLREIEVNKYEVAKTVSSERDKSNQIHFVTESTSAGKSHKWDIYCNFSKDFSKVWLDNGIKPSFSYKVKNPIEVKAFFERQFGSVANVMDDDFTSYPQDYSPEQGVKDGFFVVVHGEVKGDSQILLDKFLKSVSNKEPAYLKILQYTIEGDPIFVSLIYNGGNEYITAKFDSTRDKFGVQTEITSIKARYIKRFEQDDMVGIYLTDKNDIKLEEILDGSTDCINIVTFNK